jgi:hypothetical protein
MVTRSFYVARHLRNREVRAPLKITVTPQCIHFALTFMQGIVIVTKWLPCRAHHPVPPNPVFSYQVQIGRLCLGFPTSVSAPSGLCELMLSLAAISGPLSPHPKIPFLADKAQRLTLGSCRTGARQVETGACGFNPRASNCRLHCAGASRSRSTPMPRGKRPSTAAVTRSGARNASEMVRLTCRALHFWRAAIC